MAKKLEKFFNFLIRWSLKKEINQLKDFTGDIHFEYANFFSKGLNNILFAFTKDTLYIIENNEVKSISLKDISNIEVEKGFLSSKLKIFTTSVDNPIILKDIVNSDIELIQNLINNANKSLNNNFANSNITRGEPEEVNKTDTTSINDIRDKNTKKFEFPETSQCPYCGSQIKTPKRKKKCPECGNYIYVRTKHNLPVERFLFKEEEVPFVSLGEYFSGTDLKNSLKEKFDNSKSIKENIKEFIENLDEENIKGVKIPLYSGDSVSYIQMPLEYLYTIKADLYEALYSVEKKKEYKDKAFEYRKLAILEEVKDMKKSGIKKVQIDVVGDRLTCKHCAKLDNKVFDIDKFIENPPIPHKNCSSSAGCRCSVIAYFE